MKIKWIKGFLLSVFVLTAGGCYANNAEPLSGTAKYVQDTSVQEGEAPAAETALDTGRNTRCYVHVCGEVNRPGVYEMESGQRIYQAIELAGGFTDRAAADYLNMAEEIRDGMKLLVPDQESVKDLTESDLKAAAAELSPDGGKVNLNTATKEQLMTLKGVGEAKAEDIIRYRSEHGAFRQIEDIMKVPGIKNAGFEKIKDKITV